MPGRHVDQMPQQATAQIGPAFGELGGREIGVDRWRQRVPAAVDLGETEWLGAVEGACLVAEELWIATQERRLSTQGRRASPTKGLGPLAQRAHRSDGKSALAGGQDRQVRLLRPSRQRWMRPSLARGSSLTNST